VILLPELRRKHPDEANLLFRKYDDSALLFTLEQSDRGSGGVFYPLDDHLGIFRATRPGRREPSQPIVVLFRLHYDLAGEQARYSFLDFLRILSRLDLGLRRLRGFFPFQGYWSTRLVLLLSSSLLSSF